jgi:hypothetical protein
MRVEKLVAGDLVTTLHNGARPVKWIGKGNVLSTRGRRTAATPVIVRKGALGKNQPHADLRVTKAHSLYIDDVLIPVEFLVNHRSIIWDERAQELEIYHVELESHDVLFANGVPAESYRDDGNRWLFQNANPGWEAAPQEPYAPVLTGGPVVDAAWRRLLDRSGARPGFPLTNDPDLHLLVDGVRVDATQRCRGVHVFDLPGTSADIRIVSRSAAPQELGRTRDPRSLGVAVRQIIVRRGGGFRVIEAHNPLLVTGFHGFEIGNGWRWTDGEAVMPMELVNFKAGPIEMIISVDGAAGYIDDGAALRAA